MRRPLALAALLFTPAAAAGDPADRPNVLLILTDDQGWGDVRSHGNDLLDTPHLDRLAADGARFDRFFVSPVCAPTRAALLTGRYSLRCGVHGVTRAHETMRSEEVTVAELLSGAGYATALFGKWHNGAHWPEDPVGQGFDVFGGFCAGHWNNYFDPLLPHPPPHAPTRPEPLLPDGPGRVEGYVADIFTDAALRFIGDENGDVGGAKGPNGVNRVKPGQTGAAPWFCMVSYNTPHWPPQVGDRLFQKYAARVADAGMEGEKAAKAAAAYAMVENIDRNVGRLLAGLEAWGLEDDTVVLFLTDNGANSDRFNGGMRGRKGSAHEGGVRVPLFVRYPAEIKPGAVVARHAAHVDLLPTLCELCGVEPPADRPLDGRSLVPLLDSRDTASDWPDRRLFTFKDWNGSAPTGERGAVRTDRWRCVKDGPRWELFDMPADPGETTDVAAKFPEVRDELAAAFAAKWAEITADGFDPVPVTLDPPGGGVVELPAHEATLHGEGISYVGPNGWANDWITGWTNPGAYAEWPVRKAPNSSFVVAVRYAPQPGQERARFRVELVARDPDSPLDGAVTSITDTVVGLEPVGPAFPSPDRFERGEVYERPWRTVALGGIETETAGGVPPGRREYALRLYGSPGTEETGPRMPDVKAILVNPTGGLTEN